MDEKAGRRGAAVVYTWLAGLLTLEVVLQGFLFSGFYARSEAGFIDAHGWAGEIAGFLTIIPLVPLAFMAKFPKGLKMGWWTVAWAVLWNVQGHVLGYGIADVRWLAMVHVPVAFAILGLGAWLTGRAWGVVKRG